MRGSRVAAAAGLAALALVVAPTSAAPTGTIVADADSTVAAAVDRTPLRIEEMAEEYRAAYPDVREITASALLAEADSLHVLVDVREARERAVSRIPGSLTRADFEQQLAEDPHGFDGRQIVTYCTIGYRSGLYARDLNERGIPAINLRGSLLSWVHAGGALVDDEGATRRAHVYGRRWSLLPEGYEAVW